MQDTQRVWVVSELYYPELTSTGYFLTGIAEGLATHFSVTAVCGQPSYRSRGTRAPWRETRRGVYVHRIRATTFDKNRLVGRALNFITASMSMFGAVAWRLRRGDVVIGVTNPPALPYLLAIACKLRGAPLVLVVHDVYPEVMTRVGMLQENSAATRCVQHASRWLYQRAARIVVLGRDMHALVQAKLPAGDCRVVTIPNWGDTVGVYPEPRSQNLLLTRLGLLDKFVVQYCGNIGRTHGMEDLVSAARALRDAMDIHILVIGWGAKRKWLLQQQETHRLHNLTVLEPLPEDALRDGLNACDVALIAFVPGMSGVSVPSRMYNVLASGKPLLASCDTDSELAQVVCEEGAGWVVRAGEPNALAEAIRHAHADLPALEAVGSRGRRAAEQKYTQAHVVEQFRKVVESLKTA